MWIAKIMTTKLKIYFISKHIKPLLFPDIYIIFWIMYFLSWGWIKEVNFPFLLNFDMTLKIWELQFSHILPRIGLTWGVKIYSLNKVITRTSLVSLQYLYFSHDIQSKAQLNPLIKNSALWKGPRGIRILVWFFIFCLYLILPDQIWLWAYD